jgi:hypothetical protein
MKKITEKKWKKFVANNSKSSYSLAVCLTTLNIWEAGAKTEKEAHEAISKNPMGLSGAQAGMAINLALTRNAEDWLDKTMISVSRS